MSEGAHDPRPGAFALAEPGEGRPSEADVALLARPNITIRRRLTLIFLAFVVGSAAITAVMWVLLGRIERKIGLISVADQLNYEILQARRFEKNYLLYRGDLDHVIHHIEAGHEALNRSRKELYETVTSDCMEYLEINLWHYRELVNTLSRLDREGEAAGRPRSEVEAELRDCGSNLVACGQKVARRERESVSRMLALSRIFPAGVLVLVLAAALYGASYLWRHIVRRLKLLMEAARRIGAGDFSPIVPVRRYRDEFTDLAIAINRMTRELERRQEFLLQSQKLRAVGSLTAGVAHELNNPINNIMLSAGVLQEEYPDLEEDERLEMIADVVEQSERARKIVRNLLDFARESELGEERLALGEVVGGALRVAANQLKLSGITVENAVPVDLPAVLGDRQYLSQVFLNLILNAVEAMPEGGRLGFSADVSPETGFVAIHVRDTGTGMSPRVLQSIFDPFFTTKPGGSGTGLGLSVSLGIVQRHGGEIRVKSRLGEGTTFTVILPAADAAGPDRAVRHEE